MERVQGLKQKIAGKSIPVEVRLFVMRCVFLRSAYHCPDTSDPLSYLSLPPNIH